MSRNNEINNISSNVCLYAPSHLPPDNLSKKTFFYLTIIKIITMAVPLIGARIFGTLSGFLNMMMAAHLGHDVLAASALVNGVMMTIMTVVWSLLFGIGVLVGRFYGAGKLAEAGGAVRQCLWLGLFAGIPCAIFLWHLGPILIFFGQDKHLVDIAMQYIRAYSWGIVPSMWGLCFNQFAVGISRARLMVYWTIIPFPLIIFLSYAWLFGKFGFPAIGMAGVGYASSIVIWLSVVMEFVWLKCGKEYQKYCLFSLGSWRELFKFNYIRELMSFGLFTSGQISAELLAFSGATILFGWFGESALAARQIVVQVCSLVLMVPFATSQIGSVLISQAFGAKKMYEIRYIGYSVLLLGAILGILFGIFYCFFPNLIISFYLDPHAAKNAVTVNIAITILAITAVSQFFDILRTLASGALRGLYDTKVPMLVSVFVGCLISLPVGYFLAYYCKLGVAGLSLGFVVSFFMSATILIYRFHRLSDPTQLYKMQNWF